MGADVPDMTKRSVMNLLLVGAIGLPATSLIGDYAYFFVPPSAGGGGAGQPAKDANGNDIKKGEWLKTHLPGDYSLTQGLKGDAVLDRQARWFPHGLRVERCVHALGLRRPVEQGREQVQVPVPRLPVQRRREGDSRSGSAFLGPRPRRRDGLRRGDVYAVD